MDFTRSVENVELHQSRAWKHAVLSVTADHVNDTITYTTTLPI